MPRIHPPFRVLRAACPTLLACLVVTGTARAQVARYEFDPVHTRVLFTLSHAGFSQAMGTVSGSSGVLLFDPADWRNAAVSVTVPIAKLDLGNASWNRAALAKGLLDGADYPMATFRSTRAEAVDATHARIFGLLTLRGVTREVMLDVTFNQLKRYPLPPFRRTIGFSATTTFNRHDFGADAWSFLIGNQITLRIEAEARAAGDASSGLAQPPKDGDNPLTQPPDPAP